jgi:hypothetical protein
MGKLHEALLATVGTVGGFIIYFGGFVGWAYWMWIAIQVGSFWMFVFGIFGPFALIAGLLGLWSLLFGIPVWLMHMVK